MTEVKNRCVLFDWGDTLMRVFPNYKGTMSQWPYLESMPHARMALSALKPNWTIALATNAGDSSVEEIRTALRIVDIDQFIDKVYCYRKIGTKKPSGYFFNFILKDLGLQAKYVFMVGDSFDIDILGANRLGIRAVWFNHRSDEERTDELHCTIHDLKDLTNILNNWTRRNNLE